MSGERVRRTRILAGAAAIAAAAVVAAGLVAARSDPPASAGGEASVPGLTELDGQPTPALEGRDAITGERVSLGDFSGKRVVVNVWASWCPGCHEEAEDLRRFAEEHPDVVVLGIDVEDTRAGAREFYDRSGWAHPSIFDPSGELASKLRLQGLPTTYFLDAEHRLAAVIVGDTDFDGFVAGLRRAS